MVESISLENLQNLTLVVDPDWFYENLLNNIRNEIISYQKFVAKTSKETYYRAVTELNNLKQNPFGNHERIEFLENKLVGWEDMKPNC